MSNIHIGNNHYKNFILLKELFNFSGDDIENKLQIITYGNERKFDIITKTRYNAFLYTPADIKDHLATKFINFKRSKRGNNLLKLIIFYPETEIPGKNCILTIQDQNYNTVFLQSCHILKKNLPPNRCQEKYVTVTENIQSLRFIIHSEDGNPTYLPESIIVKHLLFSFSAYGEEKGTFHSLMKRLLRYYSLFFKPLRSRWSMSAPDSDDTLIFIKELFRLYGDELKKNMYEYPKDGMKFLREQDDLVLANKLLFETKENELIFRPTNIKDHLGTPFFDIEKDERGENAARIIICYPKGLSPGKNCILSVQNEKLDTLFFLSCYISDKTRPPKRYHARYFSIPDGTKKLRITISSTNGNPTFLPEMIILEHRVLPQRKHFPASSPFDLSR